MTRTLTGLGFALALVGSAHAQDQRITVKLDGKSHRTLRAELYKAAQKVCTNTADALDPVDTTCVEATYTSALQQLRSAPRIEQAAYLQPGSSGLR